ncbi:MAG: hypothetical protein R3Y27_06665 [Clostridia bacterium]
MKKTKMNLRKVLSTFLAVVMLVSTCTVAFGVQFTASAAVASTASKLTELTAALKSDTMLQFYNATAGLDSSFTYTTSSIYSDGSGPRVDSTIYIDNYDDYAAFIYIVDLIMYEADYCVYWNSDKSATTYGYGSSVSIALESTNSYNRLLKGENIYSISNELKDRIEDSMGSSNYVNYAVETLIDTVFYSFSELQQVSGVNTDNMKIYGSSAWDNADTGSYGSALSFNITITTDDTRGWLEYSDNDATDYENMSLKTTYTVTNTRLSEKTSLTSTYVRGYAFTTSDYINGGDKVEYVTTDTTSLAELADAYGKFMANLYEAYPTFADAYSLLAQFPNSFASTVSSMVAVRDALIVGLGNSSSSDADEIAIIASMFEDGSAYEECYDNFIVANTCDDYLDTAEGWYDYTIASPDYGVYAGFDYDAFDEATIKADYTTFKTTYYDELNKATDDAYDYFSTLYEISDEYYVNFGDNVDAYNSYAIKQELDALVEKYDGVDVTTLSETEQETVYALLDSYLNTVTSYSSQVVNDPALFDGDFEVYYKLKAAFQCEVTSIVSYFIEKGTTEISEYSESELLEDLTDFSTNYKTLQTFKNTIIYETDEETAALLLDFVFEYADALQERIYDYLTIVFTDQVAEAWDVYQAEYVDVTVSQLDVSDYITLKDTIGAINSDIYADFTSYGIYTSYIDSITRSNYTTLLANIIPLYESYAETLGFTTYVSSSVDYTDREVYEGQDVIKDDTYEVDEEDISDIIDLLDSILTDPEVLAVLGELLGVEVTDETELYDIVIGLVEDLLFTDSIINVVAGLIYPIVADAFNGISLPLTVEYSGVDIAVVYSSTLDDIALAGDLAISPSSLATLLTNNGYGTTYADAIAKLTLAGSSWTSTQIYDAYTGALTLDWGVDDACAAIDEAIANGTYTEAEYGTKYDIFVDTMGAVLEGLYPLLGALLCGDTWSTSQSGIASAKANIYIATISLSIDLDLSATANDGYVNVLGAIYELFGYKDYMTAAQVTANCSNATDFVDMLFTDIFALLDQLLDTPVRSILESLPGIVYSLMFDMLPDLLGLLKTEVIYVASVVDGLIDAIEDGVDVDLGPDGGMLNLADMGLDTSGGLVGILSMFGIDLVNFSDGIVATLGEIDTASTTKRTALIYTAPSSGKAYHIDGDAEDVLYYILTYVIASFKNGSIYDLLGAFMDDATIASIEDIVGMTGLGDPTTSAGDIIAAVVELLDSTPYDELYDVTVEYFELAPVSTTTTTYYTDPDTGRELEVPYGYVVGDDGYLVPIEDGIYSEYWTQETAEYVITTLPQFAIEVADLFFGYDITEFVTGTVDDLLEAYITMDTAASIFDLIDPYLSMLTDDETITMIIGLVTDIGLIDYIDVEGIIEHIATFEYTDYAFDDGDLDGFINMIVEFIYPIAPVLEFILLDGQVSLYGESIVVYGGNGYETALVPIFEAFGLTNEEMPSYEALCAIDDDKELVEAILEPVETFIYSLLDSVESEDGIMTAVYNLLDILPNLLYFVEQDGLNTAISNILVPIYAVLDTIRPIYNLSFTLDFDLVDIVDELLASLNDSVEGLDEYIIIPSFSELLTSIKQISSTEVRESVVMDENGDAKTYNYLVVGDAAYGDLVTMLLVEVIDNVTYLENIEPYINIIVALTDFLPESAASSELVQLLNGFADLESTDQVLFVLYYLVYGVDVAEQTLTGFYDLVDGSIAAFLEVIGGFTSEQYIEIAEATNDLASDLKDQLDEWGADPEQTEAVLTWFEEIIQAIKDFFAQIAAWFGR